MRIRILLLILILSVFLLGCSQMQFKQPPGSAEKQAGKTPGQTATPQQTQEPQKAKEIQGTANLTNTDLVNLTKDLNETEELLNELQQIENLSFNVSS